MHAFKLYTGKDNASHVLEGTLTLDRRADVVAGKATRPEPRDRREHAPGQRRFLGDAEVESDFPDGGDVAILRHPVGAQHAAEIGDGADDKTDAGAAAAFQHADLHTLHLLRVGAADRRRQRGESGKDEGTTHEEISC